MKRSFFGAMVLALVIAMPFSAMAQIDISINIGPPPPVAFAGPPVVIPLPDTYYVYVVPDIDIEMFFWNGWWWRPWQGRWYRSRYYDRGWVYYDRVPAFYYDVDPRWRVYYRERSWYGHPWHYERIDHRRLQQNWRSWHNNQHWERQRAWGVEGYRPRPLQQRQELRRERQREYQQRPEVRQHREQRRLEPGQHQIQQQKPSPTEGVRQPPRPPAPQRQDHRPSVQQREDQFRERPGSPQRHEQGPQVQYPHQRQPIGQQLGPKPPERVKGPEGPGHPQRREEGRRSQQQPRRSEPQAGPHGGQREHGK